MTTNPRPEKVIVMTDASFEPTEEDFDQIYGSRFLSAGAIIAKGGKLRVKIAKVEAAELRQDGGTTKRKFIIYFHGLDKGLVLNVTNANALRDAFGKSSAKWIGADLGLLVEQVSFGNKRIPGVRFRILGKPVDPVPVRPTPAPIKPAPAEVDPKLNDDPWDWTPNEDWVRDDEPVS
jgi:hypothetical protein